MVESQTPHQKSDAEMSMAVDNLCAMLDTHEVDVIIELLQQNNWDESAAAQAFYAKQAQAQMNAEPQTPGAAQLQQQNQFDSGAGVRDHDDQYE